jgi:hypothetical protein
LVILIMPWLFVMLARIWVEILILLNNNWLVVLRFTEPGNDKISLTH